VKFYQNFSFLQSILCNELCFVEQFPHGKGRSFQIGSFSRWRLERDIDLIPVELDNLRTLVARAMQTAVSENYGDHHIRDIARH